MPETLLYSSKLAAQALSISNRAVGYLVSRNELRTVRIGGRRLIPRSELERIAKRGTETPING
jgi:excisionase family DNA binding protein